MHAWFLEIILSANVGVCVCVSAPRALIISHIKGMRNNRIRQFYGPPFLCTTIAVSKLNGHLP